VDLHAEGRGWDNPCHVDEPGVLSFEPVRHMCQPATGLQDSIAVNLMRLPGLLVQSEVAT
jgi:hypothetical protein